MLSFRDMTYCSGPCGNTDCARHAQTERKDRKKMPAYKAIPTMWADFTHDCPDYIPEPPEAA